ncbi:MULTISPECIES: TonB-dependent receptor [Pseudomonadati]|uniref:TonB-dependent receptor n=1 Tax=Shewanella aestuarii TaxID=1028752 RepID=A0ABT0L0J2_9GAMM|nr:TonB-dependent receptor [Shewanella aestuarii]MCL1117218.1 TonB-dependent receptor [Shewanella aestuarii]GGN74177.1 TonB-dependent receptor [Shewanella aestuarii]
MSERSFSVSMVASAVVLILGSFPSIADTLTESFEEKNSHIDLGQADVSLFHYRQSSNLLAQSGVTVHPSVANADNPISIRGASNGIAVMQDNIFYSAAPYSAKNLVSLPNLFFQSSVSSIKHTNVGQGGQGSFGVLNYTTAEISDRDTDAIVNIESNADGSPAGGLIVSGKTKEYGMLLGVDYQKSEDDAGFKTSFDNKHEKTDILFKINAASLAGARNPQTTQFSYHFTDTTLDNSSIGLTENDFSLSPNTRYAATQLDYETGKRQRYALAHQVDLSGSTMFTDFYYQSFSQGGQDTLFVDDQLINRQLLQQLSDFEKNPTSQGLTTNTAIADNDFDGFGVQTKGISMYGAHEVTYQARYHSDKAEIKVGQLDYLVGENLNLAVQDNIYGVSDYTDKADAITTAVNTKLNYDAWSVNIGLGYEHVSVVRELGANTDLITEADFSDDGWLPAIEVAYKNDAWLFALSTKQAWTAASAGNTQQLAQEALQYQLALHYQQGAFVAGLSTYMHDFDNQHVTCQWGMNCLPYQEATQVNLKDVTVTGVDVNLDYNMTFDSFSIPMTLAYTYSQAEFGQSSCDIILGCYRDGEQLPWVPEQQLSASVGLVMGQFSLVANGLYQSETGNALTPGNYGVDSQLKVDLAAKYQMTATHELYVRVENVLDEDLVAKNYQMGMLAQNEMTTYIGYQGHF